jgi:hypothetical protein
MVVIPLEAEFRAEIAIAAHRLGASIGCALSEPPDAINASLQRHGATIELLCVVGSWGDTLSDKDVLRYLRDINRTGTMYRRICASTVYFPSTLEKKPARANRGGLEAGEK